MSLTSVQTNPAFQPKISSFTSVDTTAGSEVINLGDAAAAAGTRLTFLKFDSSVNTVTIAKAGLASAILTKQGESITVYSDGTDWIVMTPPTKTYIQDILDSFGHELLNFHTGAPAAVNYLRVSNAATGGQVELDAVGGDTDIGLVLVPKGVGTVDIQGGGLSIGGTPVRGLTGSSSPAPSTAGLAGATKTWADALTAILQAQGILT